MTEIEAKALALELRGHACKFYSNMAQSNLWSALITAAGYIETTAATEARHAAEMREQAERHEAFRQEVSDAMTYVVELHKRLNFFAHDARVQDLQRFIIPAPDPLVEVMKEASRFAVKPEDVEAFRAAMQARGYEWRKIGEAGE